MSRFGEQRVLRGTAESMFWRVFGVADPAHYLRHQYLKRAVTEFSVRPRRILDAGSGAGDYTLWLARAFPDAEVLGVDIDEEYTVPSQKTAEQLGIGNVRFETVDLTQLDLEGFDLVVSIDVLEHVPGQRDVLRRLTDSLVPGGLAFYHIPAARPKPVLFDKYLREFHEWAEEEHIDDDLQPEEFVGRVEESGLEIRKVWNTFGRWTGEAACSLFAIPYRNTPLNRVAQLALAPLCRGLAMADTVGGDARYAVAVAAGKS